MQPITVETTRNGTNNPLPTPENFDLDSCTTLNASNPVIIEVGEDNQPTTTASEILWYHQWQWHLYFLKLQVMSQIGIIPNQLENFPVSDCSTSLYAKVQGNKNKLNSTLVILDFLNFRAGRYF